MSPFLSEDFDKNRSFFSFVDPGKPPMRLRHLSLIGTVCPTLECPTLICPTFSCPKLIYPTGLSKHYPPSFLPRFESPESVTDARLPMGLAWIERRIRFFLADLYDIDSL